MTATADDPTRRESLLASSLEVEDETVQSDADTDILPLFEISSYGADYPVDALVQRLDHKDIVIPQWQRGFVWTPRQCGRFVESLLLGLPVPGVFFYQDTETGELVVLDGQQRLLTLKAFIHNDLEGKPFPLAAYDPNKYQTIHPTFAGKRYMDLPEEYRRRFNDSIIHATIVKQDKPSGPEEPSSIYHIFERINTGGSRLSAQELRTAVFSGPFDTLLQVLNDNEDWRAIYGRPSRRLKDQELILRYLALSTNASAYSKPMSEYLNVFMSANRHLGTLNHERLSVTFAESVTLIWRALGRDAFRIGTLLNAAVFDSVMVGLSKRLAQGPITETEAIAAAYRELLVRDEYLEVTTYATSDDLSVKRRISLATEAFDNLR